MHCSQCKEEKFLILNLCADCDPETHRLHQAAIDSVIDEHTVTKEILEYATHLDWEKTERERNRAKPVGILKSISIDK